MEYSSAFVCLMGIGTVFFGLVCLVAICYAMSAICRRTEKGKAAPAAPSAEPPAENREELAAVISAALAEELGTDIRGIRILSLRKL